LVLAFRLLLQSKVSKVLVQHTERTLNQKLDCVQMDSRGIHIVYQGFWAAHAPNIDLVPFVRVRMEREALVSMDLAESPRVVRDHSTIIAIGCSAASVGCEQVVSPSKLNIVNRVSLARFYRHSLAVDPKVPPALPVPGSIRACRAAETRHMFDIRKSQFQDPLARGKRI
jgi:hypothetical protein